MLSHGCPQLLTIELLAISVWLRLGPDACQIGTARRLRIKLAPDFIALERGDNLFARPFPILGISHHDWQRYPQRHAEIAYGHGEGHFLLLKDHVVQRGKPLPAKLWVPVDTGKAGIEPSLLLAAAHVEVFFLGHAQASILAKFGNN